MSGDFPEHAGHVCAYNLRLTEAGAGLWQEDIAGGACVSVSLCLSYLWKTRHK